MSISVPSSVKPLWEKFSKDGVISKTEYNELEKNLIKKGSPSSDEKLFLDKLKNGLDKSNSKEGVAVKNLDFISDSPKISDKISNKTSNNYILKGLSKGLSTVVEGMNSYANASKYVPPKETLFPNGVKGIDATDAQQGERTNCYLISAMSSLANKRPQDVMKMIKDNGNDTYTVDFPGVKNGKTTVPKPTADELHKYAKTGSDGSIWGAVLEKAYKKVDKADFLGGTVGSGITILTGHSVDSDILGLTKKSTTREKLKKAMTENRIVTAQITAFSGDKENNVIGAHVYSVLDFDAKSDTVKIRNPWGDSDFKNIKNHDNEDDGIFTLTIDEFHKFFSQVSYEENSSDKKNRVAGIVL